VLRTAVKPRWLALLVLVLVAASGMARLGQWQLDRARENGGKQQQQQQRPAVPLAGVLTARQTFPGRAAAQPVTATGTWDAAHQVLVAGRAATTSVNGGGALGFWVLTPLRLTDGSAVPVVRGWVATAGDPAAARSAVPSGPVAVTGVLEPSEEPVDRPPGQTAGLPAGQVEAVDVTQLIKVWPYPLLTGYLVLTAQAPAAAGVPTHLVAVSSADSALALQNLSYAVQWFLFAAFGIFLWWRLVREDHRGTLGRRRPDRGGAGPGTDPAGQPVEPVGDDESPAPAVGGTRP
jgi:cytochrome oxidase assembly protein ShyY1